MKDVIIVGAGLGGLSAAVTLAHAGFKVHLIEKNSHFGGKLMPVKLGSHHFDFGPNTITMPQVFQNIIEQTGESAADYFELLPVKMHTRNHFPDGTQIDFSSDASEMIRQLQSFSKKDADRYPDFITEVSRLYDMSERYFFPSIFQSWTDYLSPSLGKSLLKVRPLENMHHFFSRYFTNPHFIQALDRYATYIGSSPFKAPATFSMIAYLELVQGVFYAKGGNFTIADGFAAVAEKQGAVLRKNTEVSRILIKDKKAMGVELADGSKLEADLVILNGDLLSAYPKLVSEEHRPSFKNAKISRFEPSISAFVITAALNKRLDGLKHHNVFFSGDYAKEFRELFGQKAYSEEPTIYISNSSYTDQTISPDGDNLFILVNAPALDEDGKLQIDSERYKEKIYDCLEHYGIDVRSSLIDDKIFTSSYIQKKFGAYQGALYGPSSHRKKDAFLRPSNASSDIKDLYFIGGSTHPGGGSPMVTMSGQNLAKRIIKKYR